MSEIGYAFTLNEFHDKVQFNALQRKNCERLFSDVGGKRVQRKKCLKELEKGDSLTVYSLNVLVDNINELHDFIKTFDKNNISLNTIQEKIKHQTGSDEITELICAMAKIDNKI